MIEEYLHNRRRQFEADGFECLRDLAYGGYRFVFVAAKSRWTFASIAPVLLREVFIFAPFAALDVAELQQFARTCYDFAHFQLGTQSGGQRLLVTLSVYAIALLPAAGDLLQEYAREPPPPNVPGGGWTIPVIYDARLNLLHHFQKVPLFGNAFYSKFKKVLKQRLAPNAPLPAAPASPRTTTEPQEAIAPAPAPRRARQWLRLPVLRGLAGSGTLPVAINAERARRFLERLRQRQSLGRALALGVPTLAVMGFLCGVIGALSGVPLEWLPLVGVGSVVGASVRAAGKGIDRRFAVAGAVLTLLGCLVSRFFAASCALDVQVPALGNFFLLREGSFAHRVRFLVDSSDAWVLVSIIVSVCQGYYFATYRITPQEMSYLADKGPPQ